MAAYPESAQLARVTAMQDRRSDFDVTNRVCVASTTAVRDEVDRLFRDTFPDAAFDAIWLGFHDFDRLFNGRLPGFLGCDTVYHDRQHSLDMTLAMARLLAGYERGCEPADCLGPERATLGLLAALFHDAGYIRRQDEDHRRNGAEMTGWHVSRSAAFLRDWLPTVGLAELVPLAVQVVHFTGYELNLDDIELDDPRDAVIGHLLGSADLLAQMADRCYLEKCRDRLYAEFVLGGVAFRRLPDGHEQIRYSSGVDLLRQTPEFWKEAAWQRLERNFNRVYRYMELLFDGQNPYMDWIEKNLAYLKSLIERDDWQGLRRRPACYTADPETLAAVGALVSRQLMEFVAPTDPY